MSQHSGANELENTNVSLSDMLFVGFNSRVFAVRRETGQTIWSWKSPKGVDNFVALLIDGEDLIASIDGYTYRLDPYTGDELWLNSFEGHGYGTPSLVTVNASSDMGAAAARESRRRRSQNQNSS
ncbi:MAG: hypothetical protein HRU16_11220 [Planctomycetes bacterium]|nr:hypothetical protein [Planctomycetota bacterium]